MPITPTDKEYRDFGHESATNDLARTNDHIDEFFIQTHSIREFLQKTPTQPFIAGPKGSGKSLLLFKRLLMARAQSGALVLPRAPDKAFSPSLTFSSAPYWLLSPDGKPQITLWGSLWLWALSRSVLSAWLGHERANGNEKSTRFAELSVLCDGVEHQDPFDLVFRYLNELDDRNHQRRGRVLVPDSSDMRSFIRKYVSEYPPTYVFIDNHDDSFEEQPEYWLASAEGAFHAIQDLHAVTNRRIHCFMTLRPEVVWKLQERQHFPKWEHDIFRISWEDGELMDLFRSRAAHIHHDLMSRPDLVTTSPLQALFGDEMIDPQSRKLSIRNLSIEIEDALYEPMDTYLLRHTLRRPRDLIIVGNQIMKKLRVPPTSGESRSDRTREGVEMASRIIRDGYLAECAPRWPWQKEEASLRSFIKRYIRNNIIAYNEAQRINREFAEQLGVDPATVDPLNELVALGLLGFPAHTAKSRLKVQRFLRPDEALAGDFPRSADWYLVHPILYGSPFHIDPVRGQPVGPELSFDSSKMQWEPGEVNGRRRSLQPKGSTNVISWIHVSDLHFGAGDIAHRFDQRAVTAAIVRDVRKRRAGGVPAPDFVFVTGDIAFSAEPQQYREAGAWLEELAAAAGVGIDQIRMVPGNHDVNRAAAAKPTVSHTHAGVRQRPLTLDSALADDDSRAALSQKLKSYSAFCKRFLPRGQRGAKTVLDWVEQRQMGPMRAPVRIVGLSSVWCSDSTDGRESPDKPEPFVPNIVLGRGQILERVLAAKEDELVFVLTHHPPEWYHPTSAEEFTRALSRLSHLHLCGHVHTPSASALKRFAGTARSVRSVAGAAHGDPTERQHGYAWGAIRWNANESKWEVGWAPRVYITDPEGMVNLPYPLDRDGYAWEPMDLPWGRS